MKNLLISVALFFFVLGSVFFLHNKLINICDQGLVLNDNIEILVNNESWEKAYIKSMDLYNLVKKNYSLISIYINHEEVDFLNTEVLKLSQFIETKNLSDALASLHTVKSYIVHLKEIQKLNIGNILIFNLKNIILLWNLH